MSTYRILLLDDDAFILAALRRELLSNPYVGHDGLEIESFTSPLAALARARENDGYFDVVIADNRMPEMSGIDFFKAFGEIHPDAVRVILSGHTNRADLMRAINEAHIDSFIAKPWREYDLKCALVQSLRHYDLRCKNRRLAELYLERFGQSYQPQHKDKFRLMVVDDDSNILRALERELDESYTAGCIGTYPLNVHAFERTDAALAAARAQQFDVVISDYSMPFLNGIEFLCQIREVQPNAVRMLLSGVADMKVLIAAVNTAGVSHFIAKPWIDYKLRAAIDWALSHRALELENRILADLLRLKRRH
ncbi:MAG: response regulator [Gallionella sp.]|jgi:response regulator RpfG family c-di-GMP phosphodiesterase